MKVKATTYPDKSEYGIGGYNDRFELEIDGKPVLWAGNMSECPEDANLVRGLSFVYDIPDLLKQAYEAGKNGEKFAIEIIEDGNKND